MQLHRIAVNFYGCNATIGSASALETSLGTVLRLAGFNILGQTVIGFQPHGTTAVFVLAESHAVLSTWPELDFASLDLGLCGRTESGDAIVEAMADLLQPTCVTRESAITPLAFPHNAPSEQVRLRATT